MSFGYPRYRLIDRGALAGCFPWRVNGEMPMILGKIRRETGDAERSSRLGLGLGLEFCGCDC